MASNKADMYKKGKDQKGSSALESAVRKVGKYVSEYAPREKAKLDKHGTLGLGIAPKLGPIFPTKGGSTGGRTGHASMGSSAKASAGVSGTRQKGGDRFAGNAPKPQPAPEQTKKITTPRVAKSSAPSKGSTSGSITKPDRKFKDSRDELGAYYLAATSGMDIHARKKKKT